MGKKKQVKKEREASPRHDRGKSKWKAGETGVTYDHKHYPPGTPVPFKDSKEVEAHRDAGVAVLDA
jgi:hypothetical protein